MLSMTAGPTIASPREAQDDTGESLAMSSTAARDVAVLVFHGDPDVPMGLRVTVKGPAETVRVTGWAGAAPVSSDVDVHFDLETGVWHLDVIVGSRGWQMVRLRPDAPAGPR